VGIGIEDRKGKEERIVQHLLKRKWKIFVIHHSHTDIGYTERQEKIEQFHVDFIRQAVETVKAIRSGAKKEWEGFHWTCETFWAVERFLEEASDEMKHDFIEALRADDLELSGTYLNMTELADEPLLRSMTARARRFADSNGIELSSAMTADINGYSWGYAQVLVDAGIKHLLTCVHTHHGMFPIGRKQFPFYWETPKGDRLLVWNGEHYMFGNDLGLNPAAVLSYTIRDEFNVWGIARNHRELAETRISRYLRQLEEEGSPYDFVLVNVSGLLTDNASPNASIMSFIHDWNRANGSVVEIEMTTLNRFFEHLKRQEAPIPTYKGDWPDWWSDGVASTAMHTKIYREAQRTLRTLNRLASEPDPKRQRLIEEAEQQLILYAEHTWGYHASVQEPWHAMVQELEVRKQAYAANASRLIGKAMDHELRRRGEALLAPDRPFRFRVINPHSSSAADLAYLYIAKGWETDLFLDGLEVIDESTGAVVIHQRENVSTGHQIAIPVHLAPGEERLFTLQPKSAGEGARTTTSSSRLMGLDGIQDLEDLWVLPSADSSPRLKMGRSFVESSHVRIEWKSGEGIVSWIDKSTGEDLLDPHTDYGAFTPVYEVTPADPGRMTEVRRIMGRNRKGLNVRRSAGRLTDVKLIADGPLYGIVELAYQAEGMSSYAVHLKLYHSVPRADAAVRIHKDGVWAPENVYIALPFRTGVDPGVLWLEKAGALVRPGIDQLPGTLIDYYCIQEGLALISESQGVAIAAPDTPLIQLGSLEPGTRKVHGQQDGSERPSMYAWVLNNYWETNFKATLGGFYEFRYMIEWGPSLCSAEQAIARCRSMCGGLVSFRTEG
jgi:hypothetical protein